MTACTKHHETVAGLGNNETSFRTARACNRFKRHSENAQPYLELISQLSGASNWCESCCHMPGVESDGMGCSWVTKSAPWFAGICLQS